MCALVQGDGFAWGGASGAVRDRPGQARKAKGPSVPAPANVAPSAGHNFQSLGNMPVRSGGQGMFPHMISLRTTLHVMEWGHINSTSSTSRHEIGLLMPDTFDD